MIDKRYVMVTVGTTSDHTEAYQLHENVRISVMKDTNERLQVSLPRPHLSLSLPILFHSIIVTFLFLN